MNKPLKIILFIIVILFLLSIAMFYMDPFDNNIKPVVSPINGKSYNVRIVEDLSNQQIVNTSSVQHNSVPNSSILAANYLATLSEKISKIVNYMYENNLPNEETANRLYKRWHNCRLRETNSSEKSVAYTVNKGDEMRLCIRKNGNLEDMNTSVFVILHELAHLMSVSYGHNEEFRDNFSYITHTASSIGVYIPVNYQDIPTDYCGTVINTSPCSDGSCSISKK
jgi:hypothetical protein